MGHSRGLAPSAPRYPRGPKLSINVSEDVIRNSERRESSHCMIAEAVKEAVPGARYVSVDVQTIRFTDAERPFRYTYLTPRRAQVALIDFDRGVHAEPFAFRLDGAHVTKAGGGRAITRRQGAPLEDLPAKATTVRDRGNDGRVPRVVGGETPPRGALSSSGHASARRAYGLRGFER